jgi:hypothetical protein
VRWPDGITLAPWGGWSSKSASTVTGAARSIIAWRDSSGVRRVAIGTHSKLYHMNSAGTLADITPVGFTAGRADAASLLGYGTGPYGAGTYGSARPDTGNSLPATIQDLEIWGQYLLSCSADDGAIYEWQLDTGTPAAAVSNAPTSCQGVVVHPKRLVIALGAGGNPRKGQWSDLGDNTVWTPAATNQAGSIEIQQGKMICGRAVGDQVLVLTDIEAHVVDYIGLPFVLSWRKVGDACGAISKGALISTGSFACWWSKSGFYIYDGAVRPLRCDVWDYVSTNLTASQQTKISGFHNSDFAELVWLYPGDGAIENGHYVAHNYRHDHWSVGELGRNCGVGQGAFIRPFLVDSTGQVYEHEIGTLATPSLAYARSGPIELGNGDRRMHVLGIIPDEKTVGDVTVDFRTREYPNASESTGVGSATFGSTGKTDVRFSARQVEITVTGSSSNAWRWGQPRLKLAAGGRR